MQIFILPILTWTRIWTVSVYLRCKQLKIPKGSRVARFEASHSHHILPSCSASPQGLQAQVAALATSRTSPAPAWPRMG